MQSRKDLRKHTNRNNLYLIIAGIVVILVIILGVVVHNHDVESQSKERHFVTTHFNPNVTIYGVKVGNLTVDKATQKINKKADNVVYLENGKVTPERDQSTKTIDKPTVQSYFKKQHTTTPSKQNYNYKFKKLSEAQNKLNKVKQATVNYKLDGKTYPLKAKDLINKASYKDGKYKFDNTNDLTARLNKINKAVSTLHQSYNFTVPSGTKINGKTITVKNESYGWGIYVKKAKQAIEKAYINGTKSLNGGDYIYGLGYNTYAHGYGKKNHGIGDNYVVISLKKQELWVVRKGKVAVNLNDVVTGTKIGSKGDRTPQGVWYIQYKESPSTLRGYNSDGSKYASKVKYWMPFTLSGCGLHDASWRTDWSKTAYLKGGSHGCINTQPSEIHPVWQNVIKDEAVIVYN